MAPTMQAASDIDGLVGDGPGDGLPGSADAEAPGDRRIRARRLIPILVIHAIAAGVIVTGWSWPAVAMAVGLYAVRMFAITAFYHRYFSHRTFSTSRPVQFLFAYLGTTAAQRGPIWWAAHHRHHHRHSDHDPDLHSPSLRGLLWSHVGWFVSEEGVRTNTRAVPDLMKIPEIRWIDRYHIVGPLSLALAMFGLGAVIERFAPSWGTSGAQMLAWGFGVSTVALYHCTFTINSIAHRVGKRRFATTDDSRNNLALALLTLGEGWHNNHHYFPGSARQGFYWWEIDPTYYVLWVLSKLGLVWDLRPVPARVYRAAEVHARRPADGD